MAGTRKLTSSTFRPANDRCIAADGTGIVLWADCDDALLLRFECDGWLVTRHPAVEAAGGADAGGLHWRGVHYAATGELLRAFDGASSEADWREFYAQWSGEERARLLRGLRSAAPQAPALG